MAYNIKDVFYLETTATIDSGTAGGGSSQLDLSAYIDPIARGRQKGTGLAIYKMHFVTSPSATGEPIDPAESGSIRAGVIAGAGLGDVVTGGLALTTPFTSQFSSLVVGLYDFYGPKSMTAVSNNTTVTMYNNMMKPSTEVPYVVVRDNACLIYDVGESFIANHDLYVRLEVAQITLDQATLNQLLRTQTV